MSKYLFINNLSNGGAERVVSRLFNSTFFSENVKLLTLNNSDFYGCNAIFKVSFHSKCNFFCYFKAILHLLRLSRQDTLQAHLNLPIIISGLSKLLGAKFRFQVVHCFSYSSFYRKKTFYYKFIHKLIMSNVLRKASLHIFKSEEMVTDFECFFGWVPSNVKVINNPLDKVLIESQANETLPDEFTYDKHRLNVAVVGRLNKSKRPYDILSVAASLEGFVDFHFFGDGDERQKLNKLVIEEKITNVFFYGSVKNPFKFVSEFGVYLSCSESEGFPNSLVESLACNAIPIHSDCLTGPKEILCDNFQSYSAKKGEFSLEYRGLLFPVGDLIALRKAIIFVNENQKDLRHTFLDRHANYLNKLSVSNVVDKYRIALFETSYEKQN
ncbi:glycosyltransferase [Vibrio lentus]|uniref:glycosyltransferase n=1 Tax=Vibrio lentus TaxID=136468 RepID=UPI000C81B81E|nr:glycosyltransferase [Vibrio lentus]PMI85243.1 hypothetical protein BCU36_00980 [Vibrio lentus]